MLLERGANVNDYGGLLKNQPIFYAVEVNDTKIVELLIKKGADLSRMIHKNKNDLETLVHYAISKWHNAILRLLLDNSASVDELNESGDSPLNMAAFYGNTEAVERLLDHKALVNFQHKKHKWTALHYAASQGRNAIAKLLIDRGANVAAKAIYQNEDLTKEQPHLTPLIAATMWGFSGRTPTVKVLLEGGADPNTMGKNKQTAIHHAVTVGSYETVELLLSYGADPNATDIRGNTAYSIGKEKKLSNILNLMQRGKER